MTANGKGVGESKAPWLQAIGRTIKDFAMWYCAHAILYFEYLDAHSDDEETVVWEHLYLIEADSAGEAAHKAVERAKADETSCEGNLTLNDRPARMTFAGVRKTVECQNSFVDHDDPIDGTELSYNKLVLRSREELKRLAEGETVHVEFID